jgi:hypothetical protein
MPRKRLPAFGHDASRSFNRIPSPAIMPKMQMRLRVHSVTKYAPD